VLSDREFRQRGFTLLELLIVLMLIGLIVGLVSPKLGGSLGKVKVRATSNRLIAILRYARNSAVTDQQTRVVTFDRALNRVMFGLAFPPSRAYSGKIFKLPEGIFIQSIKDGRGEAVDDADDYKMYFYPAGNSSGGEITLQGKRKRLYAVKVHFITGLVNEQD